MEPATLSCRSLDGVTDAALTSPRFAARLLSDGRPLIDARFEGDTVTFTAATGLFMLRSRVLVILEDVLGEGWREHVAMQV